MKHLKTYEGREYPTLSRRKHLKGKVEILVEKHAPWYDLYDNDKAIYRGIKHKDARKVNQDIYIINPSEHNRHSLDTNNIYTLIMDNSTEWEDFPSRSNSIICTSSKDYASMFGEVYRVIPLNRNAEFGICDTKDIFDAFVGLKYINDNIDTPSDLDRYLDRTFVLPNGRITNYFELKKLLTKENLDLIYKDNTETHSGMTIAQFDEIVEEYGSYLYYLEKLMDPYDNGFSLEEYSQDNENLNYLSKSSEGHELWTESECLLVKESYIERNF